ncbi:MAG: ribosomal protein S18 acetylase RimI-like enzyme [Candidatus Azotimanducaceae bacterium]|jgi:ribosomal protein S18 acetylase RimI-like enzyme
MTGKITVRQATSNDIVAIAEFNQAMALETENKILATGTIEAGVTRMIEQPALGFYLVAEIETDNKTTEVCGCLGITYEWSDWRNGLFWWIQSVFIQQSHRRKGVFGKLYEHVTSLAQEQEEVCGIRLYVERENISAQKTYHALGMIETDYNLLEVEF